MLIDTNVLLNVLEDDPDWVGWSLHQLRAQSQLHRLAINPVIHAELSLAFSRFEALDAVLHDMALSVWKFHALRCSWRARRSRNTVGAAAPGPMCSATSSSAPTQRSPSNRS